MVYRDPSARREGLRGIVTGYVRRLGRSRGGGGSVGGMELDGIGAVMIDDGNDEPEVTLRRPIRPQDQNPRLWKGEGWTAKVVKNIDDDGWAVEMIRDGEPEPALVGPWTMGRDKKNPKPLDVNTFATLVKTVTEVLQRHAQQRRAMLHKSVAVESAEGVRLGIDLDVVPDEDDPHAVLTAVGEDGEVVARLRVSAGFKLSLASATRWVESGFREG